MFARRGLMRELTAEMGMLDAVAAATGSRQALALANLGRSDVCLRAGDHGGAERAITAVMKVAREERWTQLLEEAHRSAVCKALAWGDLATARQLAEDGRRLARETGVPAEDSLPESFWHSHTSSPAPGMRRAATGTGCLSCVTGSACAAVWQPR